jgi:hypothetical protein
MPQNPQPEMRDAGWGFFLYFLIFLVLWGGFVGLSHLDESLLPIGILMVMSVLWLGQLMYRFCPSKLSIFVFWVLTRGMSFWSTPYHEDDYYRYLWDGWVTLHGENALIISPKEVLEGGVALEWSNALEQDELKLRQDQIEKREALIVLGDWKVLLERINFPESPSIYGPVAQCFLALVVLPLKGLTLAVDDFQWLWAVFLLRFGLLALEMSLIYLLLKCFECSHEKLWLLVSCPLLMKEVGNSLHLDILLSVLLSLVVGLWWRYKNLCRKIDAKNSFDGVFEGGSDGVKRLGVSPEGLNLTPIPFEFYRYGAWLCLGFACAVKASALALFPCLFLGFHKDWKGVMIGVLTLLFCYTPWLLSGGEEIFAGTKYFSSQWSMNDFLTALVRELFYRNFDMGVFSMEIFPIGVVWVSEVQRFSRWIGVVCFGVFVLWMCLKSVEHHRAFDVVQGSAWVFAGIVYFAPVQNPWYLLWGLPFFILSGRRVLVTWCALSPFYLFNFVHPASSHLFEPFQWWVVFPHLFLLGVFFLERRKYTLLERKNQA